MRKHELRRLSQRPWMYVAAAVGALTLLASCGNGVEDSKLSKATTTGVALEDRFEHQKTVYAIPGILVFDSAVNVRSSPTKVNTNNSALIDGNQIFLPSSFGKDNEKQATVVVRGTLVKDETADGKDARYYVSGYARQLDGTFGLSYVGINPETEQHLRYFTRSDLPEERAQICGLDVFGTDSVVPSLADGLPVIKSNDAPLARIFRIDNDAVKRFVASIDSRYVETNFAEGCMPAA